MSIYKSVLNEISKYGEKITVTTENGSFKIKGLLQPLLYKNKLYLGGKQLPDGYFDSGHYLLICSAEVKMPVLGTAFFETRGEKFTLKRSETVSVCSKDFYIWAVLMPYTEPVREEFDEI